MEQTSTLLPQYEVRHCPLCQVHTIIRQGETWQHDCQETPHRFMWMNERAATCLDCDWNVSLPFSRSKDSAISSFNQLHSKMTK